MAALTDNEAARTAEGNLCLLAAAGVLALLAGCTHERLGPVSQHYVDFHTEAPRNNTVYVCHAYGCRMQTPFRFTDADLAQLKTLMIKTRKADTPFEERRRGRLRHWLDGKAHGRRDRHQCRPPGNGFFRQR